MRTVVSILLAMPVLSFALWSSTVDAAVVTPSDFPVAQLELSGGTVEFGGWFSRKLDRLFDQPGLLVMNEYQPGPDIVSPISRHHRTLSLFTSGVQGASPPSAIVNGSTITVDLSSLFFGVSKGDRLDARNIGGVATGLFNPDTLEFCLTWDHLFGDHSKFHPAVFSLHGTVVKGATEPVPLVTTAVFFATGLAIVMGVWRQDWRHSKSALSRMCVG